jgi:D-sedoheptulose 7-phosphate isomerase
MNDDKLKYVNTRIDDFLQLIARLKDNYADSILAAAQLVSQTLKKGNTVYTCGNGGSAADAQHIAAELIGRFEKERIALPAICLSTDSSVLTSVANDYHFNDIFKRQAQALIKTNDILWAISTSGASPNIINAVQTAKQNKAKIIAFTGKNASPLEELADICLCANSNQAAAAQQVHQIAYHIICGLVEMDFD